MKTATTGPLELRRTLVKLPALLIIAAVELQASIVATAEFTDTQPTSTTYQYDLTLTDTGTTTIGTFWFSWIPGMGFMSVAPTGLASPPGWTATLTNGGSAIQWVAGSPDLLSPGDSESGFMFESTLSPAELEAAYTGRGRGKGDPVATFFVYLAAPLKGRGFQGVATPAAVAVPEPPTILLSGLAISLMCWRKLARWVSR